MYDTKINLSNNITYSYKQNKCTITKEVVTLTERRSS
jgi:predicted secreted Zn-dependent protease